VITASKSRNQSPSATRLSAASFEGPREKRNLTLEEKDKLNQYFVIENSEILVDINKLKPICPKFWHGFWEMPDV
jgi:hypothetical protein